MPSTISKATTTKPSHTVVNYSIEFFHTYTDEEVGVRQLKGLKFVQQAQKAWNINASYVVFIDNYNPEEHITSAQDIIQTLEQHGMSPDYFAYEADVVPNAMKLLSGVTDSHLRRNYESYIKNHKKLPCSLLTATWYLTRLGVFDTSFIRSWACPDKYRPADRLINVLPRGYEPVEDRAFRLIRASLYSSHLDKIQDLFYDADAHADVDLF
ncbi:MAG TPA: hypothetical protein VLF91_03225 [Candidatus Saccharimonadales bacterium]|nr:hypothetical protein [Candidatus Saccharimonadales bacterium]